MAANLLKTRRRIGAIRATRKITNAMELVATVKLRKFREAFGFATSEYDETAEFLRLVVAYLPKDTKYPDYFHKREGKRLFIAVNSNLGLCGSYNNEMYRLVEKLVDPAKDVLMPIGRRGERHYRNAGYQLDESLVMVGEKSSILDIRSIAHRLCDDFLAGRYAEIVLIATRYVNPLKFSPRAITLLPLAKADFSERKEIYPPIMDLPPAELFQDAVPLFVASLFFRYVSEAEVSESASRRNAMENATDNADDLIDSLTIVYNKARQAAVTREIADMTSAMRISKG